MKGIIDMIRTKSIDLPKWRKTGRGSFRMANGKIIKPNQVFSAKESEIPEGFRNLVIRIDTGTEETPVLGIKVPAFEVQPITPAVQKILDDFNAETDAVLDQIEVEGSGAKPTEAQQTVELAAPISNDITVEDAGHGWYNVVNSVTGKILNEKKLRKADADKMLASLLG
jgi:hypothetical protein